MKLLNLFRQEWETEHFPVEDCTVPNAREKGIKDAPPEVLYLCVLVDQRFNNYGSLRLLRPYTAVNLPDEEPDTLWGWVDDSGNFHDHFERGIHLDNLVVVAWQRVPSDTDLRTLVK